MGRIAGLLVLLGVSTAWAEPHVGVMTDVGVPDAATAAVVARSRSLRAELGIGHDVVGPGVRGGLTWTPLKWWAAPVLGAGYGHFFARDANPLVRTVTGDATFSSPLLERVGYDFAYARTGIELGRKRFTFFIHAGISRVTGEIRGVAQATNAAAADSGSMVTVSSTNPEVRIWSVSADLGFIVYVK